MPDRPVPIDNAFDAVAVIVIEPPRLTGDPLIVTELFVSPALGMVATAVTALVPLPNR